MFPMAAKIQVRPSAAFRTGAVLIVCAYGILLMIPVLLAMMAVSLFQFGWMTFAVPCLVICAATFVLPFGFGNAHITRLVRPLAPPGQLASNSFTVQLTFHPRLRSGLRALIEDADDIGLLTVTDSALDFHGDSVDLALPREQIREIRAQSIGWRGLFVYPRLRLKVAGLDEIAEISVADRSAWILPTARRRTRELYRQLARRPEAAPEGSSAATEPIR